jgi:hypothetical protein
MVLVSFKVVDAQQSIRAELIVPASLPDVRGCPYHT